MKTQFLGGKLKGTPKNSLFIIKYFQKFKKTWNFLTFSQNSWKNSKLKQNLEKTQKPATPVELNRRKIVQKKAWVIAIQYFLPNSEIKITSPFKIFYSDLSAYQFVVVNVLLLSYSCYIQRIYERPYFLLQHLTFCRQNNNEQ